MKKIVSLFVFIFAIHSSAKEAPKAFDGAVFKAKMGKARFTVVYLAPRNTGKVLIKFENTGGPWDDKIIPHHMENGGKDFKLEGKKNYNTIAVRGDEWQVFPEGGDNDGITAVQDKKATESLDLKAFIEEYQKQK